MKEYIVEIGGIEHTLLLSDEDAKRYGDAARQVSSKQAAAPSNKARTVSNKQA